MTNRKLHYHSADPRGLIYEAYQMELLEEEQYRSIFLDWALGIPFEQDTFELINQLLAVYQQKYPDHPMTAILLEGLKGNSKKPKRRRSRTRRNSKTE